MAPNPLSYTMSDVNPHLTRCEPPPYIKAGSAPAEKKLFKCHQGAHFSKLGYEMQNALKHVNKKRTKGDLDCLSTYFSEI